MSLLTFLISIFLTGRTGVAMGALGILFISVLIRRKFKLFDLIFIYIVYLLISNFNEVYLFFELYSGGVIKFIRFGASEDIRYEIIKDWISIVPDVRTWLGLPLNYFLDRHGVGSHNSFIQIYESLGMFTDSLFNSVGILTTFWFLVFCAGSSKFRRSILRRNDTIYYVEN